MSFSMVNLAYALMDYAPFLRRWIKGDQEERVLQNVVNVAQTITGETDPFKVLKSLKVNPKFVSDFQTAVLKMDHELKLTEYKDRENARVRDIALAQAGRHNMRADIMVISAALGLISCLITITLYRSSLPGEAVGIISTIAGIFGACLKDAYAFEFGSSRGSKLKDTKLSELFLLK